MVSNSRVLPGRGGNSSQPARGVPGEGGRIGLTCFSSKMPMGHPRPAWNATCASEEDRYSAQETRPIPRDQDVTIRGFVCLGVCRESLWRLLSCRLPAKEKIAIYLEEVSLLMFATFSRFRRRVAVLTVLAMMASVLVAAAPVAAADDPKADYKATFRRLRYGALVGLRGCSDESCQRR